MDDSRLVYSSDRGDLRKPVRHRSSKQKNRLGGSARFPADGVVRVTRERSGRGGKEVTVIHGLPGNPDEIRKLATTLKQRCGVGGTVRERTVELQGDQSTRVVAWLEKQGHRVKLAGG